MSGDLSPSEARLMRELQRLRTEFDALNERCKAIEAKMGPWQWVTLVDAGSAVAMGTTGVEVIQGDQGSEK